MDRLVKLIIPFLLFINCKEDNKNPSENAGSLKEEVHVEVNTKTEDSIEVFNISYDSIEINKTEKLRLITKTLLEGFSGYQFTKDINELRDVKKIRKISKSKGFLKTLATDFKNDDFLEVSSVNYACVEPRNEKNPSKITIEEWNFENEGKAKSCFQSLQKYEDATIHFKTVNWIWVHQENKIFLVFALDYLVTGKEMQQVKEEIIKVISPSGLYETIQFYE